MLNTIFKLLHHIIIFNNLWLKLQEWIYDAIVMMCWNFIAITVKYVKIFKPKKTSITIDKIVLR